MSCTPAGVPDSSLRSLLAAAGCCGHLSEVWHPSGVLDYPMRFSGGRFPLCPERPPATLWQPSGLTDPATSSLPFHPGQSNPGLHDPILSGLPDEPCGCGLVPGSFCLVPALSNYAHATSGGGLLQAVCPETGAAGEAAPALWNQTDRYGLWITMLPPWSSVPLPTRPAVSSVPFWLS